MWEAVLGLEPRALRVWDRHSASELLANPPLPSDALFLLLCEAEVRGLCFSLTVYPDKSACCC